MKYLVGLILGISCLISQAQPVENAVSPPVVAVAGHPGSTVYAAVVVQISDGWAIQAHKPSLPYLIPTTLSLHPAPGLSPGGVIYPEPVEKTLAFAGRKIAVYVGTVVFLVPLTIEADAEPGLRTTRGVLVFQPCTDTYCLFPEQYEVLIMVWVIPQSQGAIGARARTFHNQQELITQDARLRCWAEDVM